MKKLTLFIILAFILQSALFSQSCLPDGIVFTTQASIDVFQTNHPNCTEIEGYVTISGADITNLAGLSVITSIGEWLTIDHNDALTNLSGLDNLTSIGTDLMIESNNVLSSIGSLSNVNSIGGGIDIFANPALMSLGGLENITSINGFINIGSESYGGNSSLTSLSGLDNVTSIGEYLMIKSNSSLTSLSGLDNLTYIGGIVQINENENLTNLMGLENLTSTGAQLIIDYNDMLTTLSGLDNLTTIAGYLDISGNASLESVTALMNLKSIEGSLGIGGNISLTSLSGLDSIDAGSINMLEINYNTSLTTCEVTSICDYLASPSSNVTIVHNGDGCNNENQVENACNASWVQNNNFKSGISIYPNPAKDVLTISYNEGITIEKVLIYNQLGKKVFWEEFANNTVDISTLRQGMYVVELGSGDWKVRKKLIVGGRQ